MRTFLRILGYVFIVVCLLCIGYIIGAFVHGPLVSSDGMSKIEATLNLIKTRYVDSVDTKPILEKCIPAMLSDLDPHSRYVTAKENKAERAGLDGKFSGVGITFNTLIDSILVINTIPNGPSDIAGVKPGDRIVRIDGKQVTGDSIPSDSIMGLLRGPDSTLVNLRIYRPLADSTMDIQVRRGEVPFNQVTPVFMVNDSLGFIHIGQFSLSTYEAFSQAYARLIKQGMKGLIIDLRGNPGGILQAALMISNDFLPANRTIIYTKGYHHKREDILSNGEGLLQKMPVYILVDENSASASEVLTGSLQDNDRAIVIGRRTFGKGLVQEPIDFNDGSAIILTIARYYTASGRCIQRPYHRGDDLAYQKDFYSRFVNGELYNRDSIHVDKKHVYHTLSGRSVYGGGGIIPDIFVPQDSVDYNSYLRALVRKQLISKYAIIYADQNRKMLAGFGSAEKCYNYLQSQGLVWLLAQYANRYGGVRMRGFLISQASNFINDILCRIIVSTIYGDSKTARVTAPKDRMIQRAVYLFAQRVTSPIDLDPKTVDGVLVLPTDSILVPPSPKVDSLGKKGCSLPVPQDSLGH